MGTTTNLGVKQTVVAGITPATMLPGAEYAGKLRWRWDYFASAVQIDAGSTIEIPGFKVGEAPIGIMVVTAGVGAATTLEVGDGTTADAYVATGGITTLANASQQFKLFAAGVMGVVLTAAKRVVITTEAANFALGKTIYFGLVYAASN